MLACTARFGLKSYLGVVLQEFFPCVIGGGGGICLFFEGFGEGRGAMGEETVDGGERGEEIEEFWVLIGGDGEADGAETEEGVIVAGAVNLPRMDCHVIEGE